MAEPAGRGNNRDLSEFGGSTRYVVDGAVYAPTCWPRFTPGFLDDLWGVVIVIVVALALRNSRFGWTVRVTRCKFLRWRNVLLERYPNEAEATARYEEIVHELSRGRLPAGASSGQSRLFAGRERTSAGFKPQA
ncbi:hypothetical protein [Nocardioides flavescens]|uniref:Uncharacterized protein n=1 Tax=Nocardioides flavescens TaxID=2691959 RepID=A0A6L7EVS9_9ACTN|nr:hypothetical protein [Nocardioides flavescens]MXG91503.1 hypothetical protein [Nocardioides flavescens]